MRHATLQCVIAVLMLSSAIVTAEDFEILSVVQPSANENDSTQGHSCEILIAAGMVDGLKVGMTGTLRSGYCQPGIRYRRLGKIVIRDVTAMEAVAMAEARPGATISRFDRVAIDVSPLSTDEIRSEAEKALEQNDLPLMCYCLRQVHRLTNPGRFNDLPMSCLATSAVSGATEVNSDTQDLSHSRARLYLDFAWRLTVATHKSIDRARYYLDRAAGNRSVADSVKELRIKFNWLESNYFQLDSLRACSTRIDTVFPELTHTEQPHFPGKLKQAGITGIVWVLTYIGADGKPEYAFAFPREDVTPHPDLEASAVAAAYKNRFSPATIGDVPVPLWVTYKVEFELN